MYLALIENNRLHKIFCKKYDHRIFYNVLVFHLRYVNFVMLRNVTLCSAASFYGYVTLRHFKSNYVASRYPVPGWALRTSMTKPKLHILQTCLVQTKISLHRLFTNHIDIFWLALFPDFFFFFFKHVDGETAFVYWLAVHVSSNLIWVWHELVTIHSYWTSIDIVEAQCAVVGEILLRGLSFQKFSYFNARFLIGWFPCCSHIVNILFSWVTGLFGMTLLTVMHSHLCTGLLHKSISREAKTKTEKKRGEKIVLPCRRFQDIFLPSDVRMRLRWRHAGEGIKIQPKIILWWSDGLHQSLISRHVNWWADWPHAKPSALWPAFALQRPLDPLLLLRLAGSLETVWVHCFQLKDERSWEGSTCSNWKFSFYCHPLLKSNGKCVQIWWHEINTNTKTLSFSKLKLESKRKILQNNINVFFKRK